jgi:hypothetical protein
MSDKCAKCGGDLHPGVTTALGLIGGAIDPHNESRLVFVQKGDPTSWNPLNAFAQGLKDEGDKAFRLSASRCSSCGAVEFCANEEVGI